MVASEVQPRLLRIDDLAHLAGLPSRTIRFYNTQGMLPSPQMKGRVAYYTQEHLQVLKIIRELKEQQNLPLETIKRLLEIRTTYGDVQMNLALKQRLMKTFAAGNQQVKLLRPELAQQSARSEQQIDELVNQGLLFPVEDNGELVFTGDDILLLELYQHLEQLGLPLALPSLLRFQLRQLVRSEIATFEQHLLPRWREDGLALEQQAEHFEQLLTLTDTIISIMHRKLLYQT